MDQLHEELKVPVAEIPHTLGHMVSPLDMEMQIDTQDSAEDSSISEGEYETCDSGLSSEKSSCGEETVGYSDQVPHFQKDTIALLSHGNGNKGPARKKVFYGHRGGMGGNRDGMNVATVDLQPLKVRELSLPDHQEHSYHSLPLRDSVQCTTDFNDSLSETIPVGDSAPVFSRPSSPAVSLPDRSYPKQSLYCLSASAPHIKAAPYHTAVNTSKFHPQATVIQPSSGALPKTNRKRKQPKYSSIISDVFDGKILSSVQCLTCDRVKF